MENAAHRILLISCYELGHQPAGISWPLAFLGRAGYSADSLDLSVQCFDDRMASRARFAAISVPMHTALRLGTKAAERIRAVNPGCHICFHGLYASLNAEYLLSTVADSVIGGEGEQELVSLVEAVLGGQSEGRRRIGPVLARLQFPAPDRSQLPGLAAYAKLEYDGGHRLAGYTEASRGCVHLCTHCPIPPVYGGRFFAVPAAIVLRDIEGLVEAGARHITFGDPDFLNGPGHSLRIARQLHATWPDLTFDFTAKVEHLIRHQSAVAEMGKLGCIFVVSAVESLSDKVLSHLKKGHTAAAVVEALEITRSAGIALRPSFVAFTPWTTMAGFIEMLEFVRSEGLIEHVDPVQFTIRLLIPPGSLILDQSLGEPWLGDLVQEQFTYQWRHPDPRMDDLHRDVSRLVERAAAEKEPAAHTFDSIWRLALAADGRSVQSTTAGAESESQPRQRRPPRLTEPWFCCAEPTTIQVGALKGSS